MGAEDHVPIRVPSICFGHGEVRIDISKLSGRFGHGVGGECMFLYRRHLTGRLSFSLVDIESEQADYGRFKTVQCKNICVLNFECIRSWITGMRFMFHSGTSFSSALIRNCSVVFKPIPPLQFYHYSKDEFIMVRIETNKTRGLSIDWRQSYLIENTLLHIDQ